MRRRGLTRQMLSEFALNLAPTCPVDCLCTRLVDRFVCCYCQYLTQVFNARARWAGDA